MSFSKTLVNIVLFKNIIKNNLYPAKVSLIIFAGVFVLTLLSGRGYGISQLGCMLVFVISSIVLTVIYPCSLQSYLVDKTKETTMASLPLKSITIWFTHYLAGYLIALVTLIIEGIGLFVISYLINYASHDLHYFLRVMFSIVSLLFIYYTLTYLVCCISGNRMGQVIFSLLTYISPIVLVTGFVLIGSKIVPMGDVYVDTVYFYIFVPLAAGLQYMATASGLNYLLVHLLLGFVVLGLCFYVYRHRDNEYIGEPLVFKKIIIVVKLLLVVCITIGLFGLIILMISMKLTFGFKGLAILLLIYLLIGTIVAIIVEVIFKSKYIYRKLLVYLPVLLVVFGLNYLIANNEYLDKIENYQGTLEANLYNEYHVVYYGEKTMVNYELDDQTTNKLEKYLSKHRDGIYFNHDKSKDCIAIGIDQRIAENNYQLRANYLVDKEVLIDFFKTEGKDYLDNYEEYNQNIVNEPYVITYNDSEEVYLLNDEIKQIVAKIDHQKVSAENMFDTKTLRLYNHNNNYFIQINDQINKLLADEKFKQRTQFMQKAQELLDDVMYEYNNDYYDKIMEIMKSNLNMSEIDNFYASEGLSIVEIGDNYLVGDVDYYATDDYSSKNLTLQFRVAKRDNKIEIVDIKAGENNDDAIKK